MPPTTVLIKEGYLITQGDPLGHLVDLNFLLTYLCPFVVKWSGQCQPWPFSGALRHDYCTQNCEVVYITLDSYYDLDTW